MSLGAMQQTRSIDAGSNTNPMPMTLDDTRADGHSRTVRLSKERITIDRNYCGVAMRLSIPVDAYQGVCVGLRPVRTGGATYELRLAHRDPDLSVSLGEAVDDRTIWADWRAWAEYFGLPTLIERNEGLVEWGQSPGMVARVAIKAPLARRRRLRRRRAAFITRRQTSRGVPADIHRGREIIAQD